MTKAVAQHKNICHHADRLGPACGIVTRHFKRATQISANKLRFQTRWTGELDRVFQRIVVWFCSVFCVVYDNA